MMQTRPMLTAKRISASVADDFDIARTFTDLAEEEAQLKLEQAKIEAEECLKQARAAAEEIKSNAEASYTEFLKKAINDSDGQVRADMLVMAMAEVAEIRKNYIDTSSWLQELVVTCVEQVIGSMPAGAAQIKTIESGIKSFGSRWALRIIAPLNASTELEKLMEEHSEVFDVLDGVQYDASVPEGSIFLTGDGGGLDVGITARIEALKVALSTEVVK